MASASLFGEQEAIKPKDSKSIRESVFFISTPLHHGKMSLPFCIGVYVRFGKIILGI
jgi:hypothetical protein